VRREGGKNEIICKKKRVKLQKPFDPQFVTLAVLYGFTFENGTTVRAWKKTLRMVKYDLSREKRNK
jgi:hypothetical protein